MKRFILFFIILTACNRHALPVDPIEPVPPGPGPAPTEKVIVAAFGAPWCSACKSAWPKLDSEIKKLKAGVAARVDFRLYVITGDNPSSLPTQAVATRYRDSLHISATPIPDPKSALYNKVVGGIYIPAAAVLSQDGKVIKSFRGGNTFETSEIVEAARAAIERLGD